MNWLQKIWEKLGNNWILMNSEQIGVRGPKGEAIFPAKIDTGAEQSSIDFSVAEKLGLLHADQVVGQRWVKSGLGRQQRTVVTCEICIKNRWQKTKVTCADRSDLRFPVLIGRGDMQGLLVKPEYPIV